MQLLLALPTNDRRPWVQRWGIPLVVALLLAIVVSHGCHGDDFDHEPCLVLEPHQDP